MRWSAHEEGRDVDLTLFGWQTVDEAASYAGPIAPARGIDTVVINGQVVWNDGHATGARPGAVLTRRVPALERLRSDRACRH